MLRQAQPNRLATTARPILAEPASFAGFYEMENHDNTAARGAGGCVRGYLKTRKVFAKTHQEYPLHQHVDLVARNYLLCLNIFSNAIAIHDIPAIDGKATKPNDNARNWF